MAGMKKAPKPGSANANAAKPTPTPAPVAVAAEAPTPKATKVKKEKGEAKPRGLGIGAFAKGLIAEGKSNEEVLAAVLEKFPGANTKVASIAWYRNKMLKDGVKGVKHQSEIKARIEKAKIKAAKESAGDLA